MTEKRWELFLSEGSEDDAEAIARALFESIKEERRGRASQAQDARPPLDAR
jgi:hypothetical protein